MSCDINPWRQICLQFGFANKIALYHLMPLSKYPQHI